MRLGARTVTTARVDCTLIEAQHIRAPSAQRSDTGERHSVLYRYDYASPSHFAIKVQHLTISILLHQLPHRSNHQSEIYPAKKFTRMSAKPIIAVTGATGSQGGSVVRHLLEDGGFSVRAISRNASSPSALGEFQLESVVA